MKMKSKSSYSKPGAKKMKPCAGCPMPAKCAAAGKCLGKGK